MMFFLLAGYCLVWLAIDRSSFWSLGAALMFGIALHAKLQVPPFWFISIILAIWVAVKYKQRSSTLVLIGIAIGSILVAAIILLIQNMVMKDSFFDPALIEILINSVIFVLTRQAREAALLGIVVSALPQLFGYFWAGRYIMGSLFLHQPTKTSDVQVEIIRKDILRASIWGLGASWLVWYLTMGLPWQRYLFPPYFIGCIFFAAYLYELSAGFDLRLIVRQASAILLGRKFNWINIQSLVLVIVFAVILGVSGKTTILHLITKMPDPILASTYLRKNIPKGARVETFESELYFLAPEINYHFPSDLVSMQLVRKQMIDPQLSIEDGILASKPDLLVIGPYSQDWHAYDDALIQEWFQLKEDIGGYQVYQIRTTVSDK